MSDVRGKSATAMSRTKKPSKLSADERALLDRIRSLNEEETEKLTFEEMITYWNIKHKIDPRSVRHAFEEAFIDRGLTNSEVLRLLERAKERVRQSGCLGLAGGMSRRQLLREQSPPRWAYTRTRSGRLS